MPPPPSTSRATPHREAKSKRKRTDDDDPPESNNTSRTSKKSRSSPSITTQQRIQPTEEDVDDNSRVSARIELCNKMRDLLTLYADDIGLVDVDALDGCLIEMVCACTPSAAAHLRRQEMQDLKSQLSTHWAEVTSLQDEHTTMIEEHTAALREHTSVTQKQNKSFLDEIRRRLEQQDARHRADVQMLLAAITQRSVIHGGDSPPPWSPSPAPAEAPSGGRTIATRRPNKLQQARQALELPEKQDLLQVEPPGQKAGEKPYERIITRSYVRDVVDHVAIKAYNIAVVCGVPTWMFGS